VDRSDFLDYFLVELNSSLTEYGFHIICSEIQSYRSQFHFRAREKTMDQYIIDIVRKYNPKTVKELTITQVKYEITAKKNRDSAEKADIP